MLLTTSGSRATLVRILERGEIPMEKPGRHRLPRLKDPVEYQERMGVQRRVALEQLVGNAEEGGLYERLDRPAPRTR
jgi:hypothetical protein